MHVAMNDFPGRPVVDITGRVLGRVGALMIDTESWAIPSFRLRLRRATARELGMGWSLFRAANIEVPTGLVMAASDAVILRAALDELHGLVPDGHAPPARMEPAPAAT
jgi:sporulation protein YlmC with PRC-barrel domain